MGAAPRRIGGKRFAVLLALMSAAGVDAARAASDDLDLAWLRDGKARRLVLPSSAAARSADPRAKVPLGSLWKLFVYAYLSERETSEPVYRCAAGARAAGNEDEYCCQPGGSIGRDEALARSCGPYFDADRLGIDAAEWRRFWSSGAPPWLGDLAALRPATEVTIEDLLAALASVPAAARHKARAALLAVLVDGYAKDAWPVLGSAFRFKTYSWHVVGADGKRQALGGGAGWLDDGTPIWFGAAGASRPVIERYAQRLAAALPASSETGEAVGDNSPCVEVRFFARYPIQRLIGEHGTSPATGTLRGNVQVFFANGSVLPVRTGGRLELSEESGHKVLRGQFDLDEYVARVIDREGRGEPREAARALAIAARSYVLQRGRRVAGCWLIDDSSATQRVSPHPPSAAAQSAARFTSGLVLPVPVQYRRDDGGAGRLSWRDTVAAAQAGERADALLAKAFGPTGIAGVDGSTDCRRLPEAEAWLAGRSTAWARHLRRLPGYERPDPVLVCGLGEGHPYADQRMNRVYVRDWMSGQGRLALTHEYLHLAFRHHPRGADEEFIEFTARNLERETP